MNQSNAVVLLFWLLIAVFSFVIVDSAPISAPWNWVFRIGIPFVFLFGLFLLGKQR